ncbi:MAG: nicotinate-nucleotide adenylyltransferase [Eubacteriales bacterium]|nr:nicotinate-nucleotide adenylyltransferase [Eubacteriales bacterium]
MPENDAERIKNRRRIGIMGGTFDPVHNGHLFIAARAREEYGLSEIWFMPAGEPYFKSKKNVTSADMRLEMTRLAVDGREGFSSSDFEIRRCGRTYTADTLILLTDAYPDCTFYFIIGADSLFQLEKWDRPEIIFSHAVILCAGRDGQAGVDAEILRLSDKFRSSRCDIRRIHAAEVDISSTMIRERVREGKDISGFVPASVLQYIRTHRLYLPETGA